MSGLVTGVGALASVGAGADEVFEALCAGRSGLGELGGFNPDRFRARHAYEVDDRLTIGVDLPRRATAWLVRVIEEAARDAGLGEDLSGIPILIGTGLRELRSVELSWRDGVEFGLEELHFGTALRRRFGAARTYTFCNACSASLYALALGSDLLDTDEADAVIVAGVDSITESMYGLLDRVQFDPPDTVRPFAKGRKGVLMGDGAAAVVLRPDEPAFAAEAHGRLRAVGMNCDAHHVTAPDPAGIAAAISDAHAQAGVKPEDIDLILLHGTGTLLNDDAEAKAVAEVFGSAVGIPLMTAVKSMTGHTSGGSGLLSLVVALRSLACGRVPPTLGLGEPVDSAAAFQFVRDRAAAATPVLAQVNAFGFGGVNAVAVVEKAGSADKTARVDGTEQADKTEQAEMAAV